ncbi:MAG TPA: ParB/RepB/Spo0J family partition protein [Planctomycetota bacterium]|nr:ParB/RepB/Spo0J family partition protein [Planctomycetota bacterium]
MDAPKPKRGLSALLATTTQAPQPPVIINAPPPGAPMVSAMAEKPSTAGTQNVITNAEIPLSAIRPNPTQPRTNFDPEALAELAASIKARGVIQPLVLRQLKPEEISGELKYELIAGERRWRASQIAGLKTVPAVVKHGYDAREILLVSLVENLQRDDLNPIEEAIAYQRLASTFNLTHDQIAEGVGKNRATVSNMIRVLDLPSTVQDAIREKKLSLGHAKILLGVPDAKLQAQLASKVQGENLTVRDLEKLIAWESASSKLPVKSSPSREKGSRNTRVAPPHLQEAENQLREHFGTRVSIEEGLRKGRIIIEFYSVEDFERITKLMNLK